MYIYIHIYIYIDTHTYTHIRTHTHTHKYTFLRALAHIYCTYICMYNYIGYVAVQTKEYGLFLLKPNYIAMEIEIISQKRYGEQLRTCDDKIEKRFCQLTDNC